MGLGPDTDDLVKALQRNYGVSGQEHFTVAVDLAQTMFKCCGIDSANEYDTSLWRLQGLGPRLAVPLTCCKLLNGNDTKAYLSPRPINQNFCQDLEKQTHSAYRHTVGCWIALDQWYREHYFAFLMVGFVIVLVEFSVLMSTILSCTRIYHYKQELKEAARQIERDPPSLRSSQLQGPPALKQGRTAMTHTPLQTSSTNTKVTSTSKLSTSVNKGLTLTWWKGHDVGSEGSSGEMKNNQELNDNFQNI
nr:unnamed protein product [Callosobruchus analis]